MIKILTAILLLVLANCQEGWWDTLEGVKIKNLQHFKDLLLPEDAPYHDTHIMIEFYMENCRFCMSFKDDWNQLVNESYQKYNTDPSAPKKVEFFLIDGIKEIELRRRYRINGFPSFVYLRPGSRGREARSYEQERTKEDMAEWLDSVMKKGEEEI